jgi:hypothetical protein
MAMPNDAAVAVRKRIVKLMTPTDGSEPQVDLAAALARRLHTIGYGQNELRYIQKEVFGGHSWKRTVDPDKFGGKANEIWAKFTQGMSADSGPDFFLPGVAIHDGVDADTMSKWNWRALQDYLTDVTENAPVEQREKLINEATDAIAEWESNPQLSKRLDADKRRALYGFLHRPQFDDPATGGTGFHRRGNESAPRTVEIAEVDSAGKPIPDGIDPSTGEKLYKKKWVPLRELITTSPSAPPLKPEQLANRQKALEKLLDEAQPLI